MIFIVNLIILIFFLYIVAIQIQQYNNIISDKYRFRYFALRDRLALLVANNEIQDCICLPERLDLPIGGPNLPT